MIDIAQLLSALISEAVKSGCPLHQVECPVQDYVFRMEHSALTVFIAAQGDGVLENPSQPQEDRS